MTLLSDLYGQSAVLENDFNANTFLYAVTDDTPVVKTRAEVLTLLSGQAGADFSMNTHKIVGVVDPTAAQEVATKKYVDDNSGSDIYVNAANYTGTDRAKIQAAIDEAQTNGGIVYIPGGTWTVDDHDSDGNCLEITDGITIIGDGMQATIIQTASTTAHIFHVSTALPIKISDMQIKCTGTSASAQSGIYLTSATENSRSLLDNIFFQYLYYGIHFHRATWWKVRNCSFLQGKKYEIFIENTYLTDSGDQVIEGSHFYGTSSSVPDAAIRHESGGGVKFSGNKIWYYATGYDVAPADGVDTSVLVINGNSIEHSGVAIRLRRKATTGLYKKITIGDNEIHEGGIVVDGAAGDTTIQHVTVGDNVFYSCGIVINNGANMMIDGNTFHKSAAFTYAINNAGGTGIYLGDNIYEGFTAAQLFTGTFLENRYPQGPYIRGATPGFWLDETGVGNKGAFCVLDGLTFQIQRRAQGFGAYEASPFQVNLTTGNGTFLGTVTASCGTLTCDYVFEKDYALMSLDDLQKFVTEEKKLPHMTIDKAGNYSTATLREELVEKVEEQALYILQLHERLKVLEKQTIKA